MQLRAKGLKLVREAGGEKPEIRWDGNGEYVVEMFGEGEISNIKLSNHTEENCTVIVDGRGSAKVKGCDLHGSVGVEEDGTLLLKDSTVHHATTFGVDVDGIAGIQDCTVEDGTGNGIQVGPAAKATISDTKVRRNGVTVKGEARARTAASPPTRRPASTPERSSRRARPSAPSGTTLSAAATTRATALGSPTTGRRRAASSRGCRTDFVLFN